jgi:hypothetical protein
MFNALSERLDKVTAWLFGISFGKFVALVLIFAILRNGLFFVPNIQVVWRISQEPTLPEGGRARTVLQKYADPQYLLTSYVGPLLAWKLHATGHYVTFALLHLAVLVLFFPFIMWQAHRRFGDSFARYFGIAFAVLPVSTTVFTWLGNSDVFTFLLASTIFLGTCPSARGRLNLVVELFFGILLFPAGFLLGVNHFEQGVFLVAFTTLAQWIVSGPVAIRPPWRIVWAGLGLLFGKWWLHHWFAQHDIHLSYDRFYWVTKTGLSGFAQLFLVNLHPLLFSLFNVFWGAVLLLGVVIATKYSGRLMCLAFLFFLALASASVTLDTTRVYALLSWPVVLAFILLAFNVDAAYNPTNRKIMTAMLAFGLVVPPLMVWQGTIQSSVLFRTLKLIYEIVVHGFQLPTGAPLQPFPARP